MPAQADITLIHLQSPAPVVSPPLGCLCLLAALERAGIRAEFRDYQLFEGTPHDPDGIVRFICEDSADIIGIGAMVSMLPSLIVALRKVKAHVPRKRIVLGGPGPASVAESLLRAYPVADAIVLGEGEETLPEVVRALTAGTDLTSVAGLVVQTEGGVRRTPPRARIGTLDELPLPAYDRVDLGRYNGALPVELSRGCPFSCAFCETSAFWGRQVRHYAPERVAGIVHALRVRSEENSFGFVDDTFGVDRRRADHLLNLLRGIGARWTCSTRVERLEETWVGRLAAAGCTGVFLGIESGSDTVLARINKRGVSANEVAARVALLEGRFDPITTSFIWGFPFESLQDVADTLALASTLRGMGAVTPLHLLSALPSAPLTREFIALRRFDPQMVSDLSAAPLDAAMADLIRADPEVFSSFYHFDHPALSMKRALVRRLGRTHATS